MTREQIDTLVYAGLIAPTARNEQEVHISVVKGDAPILQELQADLNPKAEKNFYYGAPVVFFLSGKDSFGWSVLDAGIAVENMHLAAKAMGLGSLVIGCVKGVLTGERKAYYNKALAVPDGYTFCIALAVGVPDTTKDPHAIDIEKNVSFL